MMRPIKANKVNDTQCDIQYNYIPVGKTASAGDDKRRFTFIRDANQVWDVSVMGDYLSGITII
jgi:hypothetical protein